MSKTITVRVGDSHAFYKIIDEQRFDEFKKMLEAEELSFAEFVRACIYAAMISKERNMSIREWIALSTRIDVILDIIDLANKNAVITKVVKDMAKELTKEINKQIQQQTKNK